MSKQVREYIYGTTPRDAGDTCRRCTVKLEYGDVIISKHKAGNKRTIYHKKCWEKLFQ